MGANAGRHQQHDVGKGHSERNLEHSFRAAAAMGVEVHLLSVRAAEARFKARGLRVVGQFVKHIPAAAEAAIDLRHFTARLKPRPFKTDSNWPTTGGAGAELFAI